MYESELNDIKSVKIKCIELHYIDIIEFWIWMKCNRKKTKTLFGNIFISSCLLLIFLSKHKIIARESKIPGVLGYIS